MIHGVFGAWARMDRVVLLFTAALVAIGALAIHSATHDTEPTRVVRQLQLGAVGLVVMLLVAATPYQRLVAKGVPAYALALLALALVPAVGPAVNGAQRWIMLGGFQMQPSEPLKVIVVLMLARVLRFGRELSRVRDWVPPLILVMCPVVLIARQPDLGTALVYVPVAFAIVFVAGIPLRAVVLLALVGALAVTIGFQTLKPYQRERVMSTVYRERQTDYQRAREGFQLDRALLAVGGGGVTGQGWRSGQVTQSGRLPYAQSDFVFAPICEELGFLGGAATITLFLLLVGAIFRIAWGTRDPAGRLLCVGIGTLIATQAFIHVGVNLGVVPTTGMPLPFVSDGGSALVTFLGGIGLVLSVSAHRVQVMGGSRYDEG